MHRPRISLPLLACLVLSALANLHAAVYEGKQFTYQQPDGSAFEVKLWGNEYAVNTETVDGWAIIQDANGWWTYARPDGNGGITASAVRVGSGDPATLQVAKHLRLSKEQRSAMRTQQRIRMTGANVDSNPALAAADFAPPTTPTTGVRRGITIMVRFPDRPDDDTITHSQVDNFCNAANYTEFGNKGSIKAYFSDVSNGLLTYSNIVYSTYYTTQQNRSYYADPTANPRTDNRAQKLVTEALNYLDNQHFDFSTCDADGDEYVDAVNIFYAGSIPNTWGVGLWPHKSNTFTWTSTSGMRVLNYQMSNMGSSLSIGTFCHESGHLLCGFPDLYDYQDDSAGGAGYFCLMGAGATDKNPARVCGYLALKAGWRTPTDITAATVGTLSLTAANTGLYRFLKPGDPTEYFLLECRYKAGRDLGLPASGIAIWHVDELGDRDNQSYVDNTDHDNFECALVQADNRRHLENGANYGDAYDLWHSGNSRSTDLFIDSDPYNASANDARWWDGSASGLGLIHFSRASSTMTVELLAPSIAVVTTTATVDEGDSGATTVAITLRRSGKPTGSASVDWRLVNGTATASGLDFTGNSGTVLWMPGETGNKTVQVSVLGDTRDEANETFTFQISGQVPGTVQLGNTTSTITITDDDDAPGTDGSFEFASNLVTASESAGTATLTVRRLNHTTGNAVTVPWELTGGTATTIDYFTAAPNGTLSWGVGDFGDKTISVSLVDDALTEGDETVIFQLGAPSLATATVPFPDSCTLTIADDDDSVALLGTAAGAQEPVGSPSLALIPVRRFGSMAGTVSIDYHTIVGGTAVDSVDYTPVTTSTLTWAAGDGDTKYCTIQLLPDNKEDGDKTVMVELVNPVGCTISGPATATLTIFQTTKSNSSYSGTASSSGIDGGCGAGTVGVILGLGIIPLLRRRRR